MTTNNSINMPCVANQIPIGNSSGNGFISIPRSPLVTIYTSGSGTWTPNINTQYVEVWMWGGGAGGAGGSVGSATLEPGSNGGNGSSVCVVSASISIFSPNQSYSIGSGGSGGSGVPSSGAGGNKGTNGGNTIFGNLLALGGVAFSGSNIASSLSGNFLSFSELANSSQTPGIATTVSSFPSGLIENGSTSILGSMANCIPTAGGSSSRATTAVAGSGGNAGGLVDQSQATLVSGALGGISGTTFNGANASAQYLQGGIMSAGFGGGAGCSASATTASGNGGNGSQPGGGGGAGGPGLLGLQNSGSGGNGGDGMIIVYEYF